MTVLHPFFEAAATLENEIIFIPGASYIGNSTFLQESSVSRNTLCSAVQYVFTSRFFSHGGGGRIVPMYSRLSPTNQLLIKKVF